MKETTGRVGETWDRMGATLERKGSTANMTGKATTGQERQRTGHRCGIGGVRQCGSSLRGSVVIGLIQEHNKGEDVLMLQS